MHAIASLGAARWGQCKRGGAHPAVPIAFSLAKLCKSNFSFRTIHSDNDGVFQAQGSEPMVQRKGFVSCIYGGNPSVAEYSGQ